MGKFALIVDTKEFSTSVIDHRLRNVLTDMRKTTKQWYDAYENNPISTPIDKFLLQCVCGCERNMYVCANVYKLGVATNHGKLWCD